MSGGKHNFFHTNVFCERRRGYFGVQVAYCCRCPVSETIPDTGNRPKAVSTASRIFRDKGWTVGARRTADLCPDCTKGFTKPKAVAEPIPAPPPPAAPAQPKEPIMVSSAQAVAKPGVAVGVSAAPPRQPTLDDNKKIRRALDDCYDDEAGHYRGSDTDHAVAERLGVPRAWVTAERQHAYGPERCEADGHDLDALKEIVAMAGEVSAKHLDLAATADTLGRNAQRLVEKLAARGVQ